MTDKLAEVVNTIQMPANFISTGSISQDALRLGFQTTCEQGLRNLFKVDDITLESCKEFKERHEEEVREHFKVFEKNLEAKIEEEFIFDMRRYMDNFYFDNMFKELFAFKHRRIKKIIDAQKPQKATVTITEVGEARIDVKNGVWRTPFKYTIEKKDWEGYFTPKKYNKFKASLNEDRREIVTEARRCVLKYVDYDNYHDKYIPDEAVQTAIQAKTIGIENIKVVFPIVENTEKVFDPIIIGFVENQMFILAWFGYNGDHMSCNV